MKFRTLIVLVAILAALVIVHRVSAKSDMYLNYTSFAEDGTEVVGFRGVNGAAYVTSGGAPGVGWVEGYTPIDCNWSGYCSGIMFQQDGTWFSAEWI